MSSSAVADEGKSALSAAPAGTNCGASPPESRLPRNWTLSATT
jgi:hypothetical protein